MRPSDARQSWVSVKIAAGLLDVSEDTVVNLIDRGELKAANVSAGLLRRRFRVHLNSLRELAVRRDIELPEKYLV